MEKTVLKVFKLKINFKEKRNGKLKHILLLDRIISKHTITI